MSLAVVWFRRDLRLEDNPALTAAIGRHDRVLCVYIHAPDEEAPWAPGAASRWWLHHSLTSLDAALKKRRSALRIFSGPTKKTIDSIVKKTGADAVYWNRLYEPAVIERDRQIKQALIDNGVDAESFNAALMFEPWEIKTGDGGPYKVFTPFWRKARAQLVPKPPLPAPKKIATVEVDGIALERLALLPKIPWDREFPEHWQPGERGAHDLLERFADEAVKDYKQGRDRPDRDDTSRLSPHLHFGEIGPRQIVWKFEESGRDAPAMSNDAEAFIRELGWRDFSHHLLFHFPQTPTHNLNKQFDRFPWARSNKKILARWQRGETGIPIIDAGMRQLWRTGWMHNRVRMLVASYLTKNLRQNWRHGARWFWDTLVDADLANNTQGWQWTAGSGADAAPYFRIFNPITQGEKFDPQGAYVRRWVPELAKVPAHLIHDPSRDPAVLKAAGYPQPMVDLRVSREQALQSYSQMRASK
jgi:deoxyribodipyrimidine photo-lyase